MNVDEFLNGLAGVAAFPWSECLRVNVGGEGAFEGFKQQGGTELCEQRRQGFGWLLGRVFRVSQVFAECGAQTDEVIACVL